MIRTLTLAVGLGVAAGSASAAFVGGKVVSTSVWNNAAVAAGIGGGGQVFVFRMFAEFDEADDVFQSVFDANFNVKDGTFFQSPFGGDTAGNINPAFFPAFPEVEWDTFVSMGNLTGPSSTSTDPNFNFKGDGTGVDGNTGWFTNNPPAAEGTLEKCAVFLCADSSSVLTHRGTACTLQ